MKFKVYNVYLEDREDVYKITVPAESEKKAIEYVKGNGEVIKVKLNPDLQDIHIETLANTLLRNGWEQLEVDVITRTLMQVGLDRQKGQVRDMSKYDYEVEVYVVKYGAEKEREFDNEDESVEFARKQYERGSLVSIKLISHLVGWW